MQRLLEKMAAQLDALDEASLMALWEGYARRTARFEPSEDWERAALALGLIQAKHMKNQLFNYHVRMRQLAGPAAAGAAGEAAPPGRGPCPGLAFTPEPGDGK